MKHNIAIVTDSCADVPESYVFKYHIYVLPMLIQYKDGEYRDGIDIHSEDVYKRLHTELAKTSAPLGADIEALFKYLQKKGYKQVIAIMLSGSLSGTCNFIRLAAEDFDLDVHVVDSYAASIGVGALALQAAIWREEGISFPELCKRVDALRRHNKVFFSIDTLEYLAKGGRIGKATALAGAALNIKPILSFDEIGEIYSPAKVRGSKGLIKKIISLIDGFAELPEHTGLPYNLVVADGGAPEQRDILEAELTARYPDYMQLYRAKIGAALSTYLGDNLLGAGIQFVPPRPD